MFDDKAPRIKVYFVFSCSSGPPNKTLLTRCLNNNNWWPKNDWILLHCTQPVRAMIKKFTLPETNIAPEQRPSQKRISFSNLPTFQGVQLAVSFREGKLLFVQNDSQAAWLSQVAPTDPSNPCLQHTDDHLLTLVVITPNFTVFVGGWSCF